MLCLLTASQGFTKPGSTDSVKVSLKSIYNAVLTADSLDECMEVKDSLNSAIHTAKKTIEERDRAIYFKDFQIKNLESIDFANNKIIFLKDQAIKKKNTEGWLKFGIGILIGFAGFQILK